MELKPHNNMLWTISQGKNCGELSRTVTLFTTAKTLFNSRYTPQRGVVPHVYYMCTVGCIVTLIFVFARLFSAVLFEMFYWCLMEAQTCPSEYCRASVTSRNWEFNGVTWLSTIFTLMCLRHLFHLLVCHLATWGSRTCCKHNIATYSECVGEQLSVCTSSRQTALLAFIYNHVFGHPMNAIPIITPLLALFWSQSTPEMWLKQINAPQCSPASH